MVSKTNSDSKINTPAALIDLDIVERNLSAFQAYCEKHNIAARPHIKTHKLPRFAKLQLAHGAFGITCQKISEAEAMISQGGIYDLLITYNILGAEKLTRLKALKERIKKLTVVADNATTINGLAEAFSDSADAPLNVFIECNTGADRCGVETTEETLPLAQLINKSAGLHFAGLMTYPPKTDYLGGQKWLSDAIAFLNKNSIEVENVSCGGTPQMWDAHKFTVVTEWRAGTYIYNDKSLVTSGNCTYDDCALNVLATVVSRPTLNRAIIDAGSKTLTPDLQGQEGYGAVLGHPNIMIDSLSEEHGRLVSKEPIDLEVGQTIRIVPNHVCVVSNMFNQVYLMRSGEIECIEDVVARGCIT